MEWFFVIVGIALLLAGVFGALLPSKLWQALAGRGTRLANQLSSNMLLLFSGLLWLGLTLVVFYGADIYEGWRSRAWQPVQATVLESRIVTLRQVRSTNETYRPQVSYRYEFDGNEYRADRVDFGQRTTVDRPWLEQQLASVYAPGASVRAYVNPAAPSEATLQTGVEGRAVVLGVLGVVLAAVGGYYVRMLLRDWNGDGGKATNRNKAASKTNGGNGGNGGGNRGNGSGSGNSGNRDKHNAGGLRKKQGKSRRK